MARSSRAVLGVVVGLLWLGLSAAVSRAGGGPGNVVVVVNTRSWASLTVANEFIRQRSIPPGHVVALDLELPRRDDILGVDAFRETILKPVLGAIRDRGLEDVVDTVVYSADIPTAIDFSPDLGEGKGGRTGTLASINGLTYLHELVLAKQPYWALDANRYFRRVTPLPESDPKQPTFDVKPSVGFSAWPDRGKSPRYLLSTVLGVTSGRGNSAMEAVECMKRSASADGTHPKGTFYYMDDGAIRTETRRPWFKSAIAKLEAMGHRGERVRYQIPKDYSQLIGLPIDRDDIIGAMLGQQYPRPDRSGSKTLPGAIVENLTSEGGMMGWDGWQVTAASFIRFGAAGSAGTVTEPMAIWQKFPSPFLFVHYASGCSLGEAFYQSVSGPYQLLIVGDPLCRPFATIPTVTVEGLRDGEVIAATADRPVHVTTKAAEGMTTRVMALVDGRPSEGLALTPGYHEYMAVATTQDQIASQGWKVVGYVVQEAGELARPERGPIEYGQDVTVRASVKGAQRVEIWHCGRVVKTLAGDAGDVRIPSAVLGLGPVRLDACAEVGGRRVWTAPVRLDVVMPPALAATRVPLREGEALLDGPVLTTEGAAGAPRVVKDMRRRAALQEGGVATGQAYAIEAYFEVPADDVCQFQVWTDGKVTLKVDDAALPEVSGAGWRFLPIALAKGTHRLVASGTAGPARELDIRYGPPGTRSIGQRAHATEPDHLAMHFGHVGPKPPATTQAATSPAAEK